MEIQFENEDHQAKIKVIGVGGCGGNLVRYMNDRSIYSVRYMAINTDAQALNVMPDDIDCVHIGIQNTRGLGAGANPQRGAESANFEASRIRDIVQGLDMIFIAAGMGKGTGTGASPVIAKIAREEGVLTIAVVTMPFNYERRNARAEEGLIELAKYADSVIVVPNEKLIENTNSNLTAKAALSAANEVLFNAVRGVSDIINKPGMMNVDFNDVRTAMHDKGKAVIGSSVCSGPDRAITAAQTALHSPLIENIDLSQAGNVLVNITTNEDSLIMAELQQITDEIENNVHDFTGEIFTGIVFDEDIDPDEIRVTIIVTGVSDRHKPQHTISHSDSNNNTDSNLKDPSFVSGRKLQNFNDCLDQNDGNIKKVPTVLRQQIS